MLWLGKLRIVVAVLALATVASTGAGFLAFRASARGEADGDKEAAEDQPGQARRPPREALRAISTRKLPGFETVNSHPAQSSARVQ